MMFRVAAPTFNHLKNEYKHGSKKIPTNSKKSLMNAFSMISIDVSMEKLSNYNSLDLVQLSKFK
jgi:hypothetical protein